MKVEPLGSDRRLVSDEPLEFFTALGLNGFAIVVTDAPRESTLPLSRTDRSYRPAPRPAAGATALAKERSWYLVATEDRIATEDRMIPHRPSARCLSGPVCEEARRGGWRLQPLR